MKKKDAYGEFAAYLENHPDTRYLELLAADMNGILRGKRASVDDAKKIYTNAVNWCAATLVLDAKGGTFDNSMVATTATRCARPVVPGTLAPVP
jgi:glutamine synthetase